jgi:hypothetical protein
LSAGESHRLFLDFDTKITQVPVALIEEIFIGNSWINISTSESLCTLRGGEASERGSDLGLASLTELSSVDNLYTV